MRKLLTTAAFITTCMIGSPSLAEGGSCENAAKSASIYMDLRQKGISLSVALSSIDEIGLTGSTAELITAMIKDAWSQPRYFSAEKKEYAISEFRDNWHLACLEVHGNR